jgi:hypothetical protein
MQTLSNAGEQFKNIQDGGEALKNLMKGVLDLAKQFNLKDITELLGSMLN